MRERTVNCSDVPHNSIINTNSNRKIDLLKMIQNINRKHEPSCCQYRLELFTRQITAWTQIEMK